MEQIIQHFDFINLHLEMDVVKIITYIILGMSVILHIFRRKSGHTPYFKGIVYVAYCILFITICLLELVIFVSGVNPVWFCVPSQMGWFLTVINFFLFSYVLYNQVLCFFYLSEGISNRALGLFSHPKKAFRIGYISLVVGLIILYICNLFFIGVLNNQGKPDLFENIFYITIGIIFIFQVITCIMIINTFRNGLFFMHFKYSKNAWWKNSRWMRWALLSILIYLMGAISISILIMYYIGLFIVAAIIAFGVIIAFFFLSIFADVQKSGAKRTSSSSSSSSSDSNPNSNQYCRTCKYYPGNGYNCGRKGGSMVSENSKACFYWER